MRGEYGRRATKEIIAGLKRKYTCVVFVPMNDYGFFGPGSPTWRVWGYPTSATIGFQRSVVIEELDPFLIAAVEATNKVRYKPRARYDRTLRYFATVAFGDTHSALKAAEVL